MERQSAESIEENSTVNREELNVSPAVSPAVTEFNFDIELMEQPANSSEVNSVQQNDMEGPSTSGAFHSVNDSVQQNDVERPSAFHSVIHSVQQNDMERPSTSREFHNVNNPVNSNNGEQPRNPIDDATERVFGCFLRETRSREFKEALLQRDQAPYIEYFFGIETEIDAFLENETSELTDRICAYATHSWPYNHLNLERRHRLSRLRTMIEKREMLTKDAKYNEFLNNAYSNEKDAEKLKPICVICTLDLRNDYFVPLVLSCGHVYHKRCIRKQLRKRRECPLCRIPVDNFDGTRLFFSY